MGDPFPDVQSVAQPLVFKRWLFLADKLERQPELLTIPLENIRRWKKAGRLANTGYLDQWVGMIEAAESGEVGMTDLLEFLRKDGEETRELKSCSPFAGVLTREERDQFTCAWTH